MRKITDTIRIDWLDKNLCMLKPYEHKSRYKYLSGYAEIRTYDDMRKTNANRIKRRQKKCANRKPC